MPAFISKLGCAECGGTCGGCNRLGDAYTDRLNSMSFDQQLAYASAAANPGSSVQQQQPQGPNNDAAIIGAVGQGVSGLFGFLGNVLAPKPQQTIVYQTAPAASTANSKMLMYGLAGVAVLGAYFLLKK